MDYKKISNELLFTYHKNIDFVYKVLGEFLYSTNNFSKKFSKVYKTSEGKVLVSWDKYNDWSISLNESLDVNKNIKLSINEDVDNASNDDNSTRYNYNNAFRFIYDAITNLTIPEDLTDKEYINKFYESLTNIVISDTVDSDLSIKLLDEIDYCKASNYNPYKVRQRLKHIVLDFYKSVNPSPII